MKLSLKLMLLLLLPHLLIAVPDAADWTEPRFFHKEFDERFDGRIHITEESHAEQTNDPSLSPNGSYWFEIEPVDEGTGLQRILVSSDRRSHVILLKEPYGNYLTEAYWINEKLVFVRVFWGRIIGTDLIFDAEEGKVVFKEMVMDGMILYQQTQEAMEHADRGEGDNSE